MTRTFAGALRRGALIPLAALLCVCLPASGQAAQTVTLHTSFTPDRLGVPTTIGFGFTVQSTTGGLPSPLTHVALSMPSGMNYLTTTLGLEICEPKKLLEKGLAGCPVNSRLGSGSAFVEVPFGDSAGQEIPDIQALMGPSHNNNAVVLFYADGRTPVFAQLVFDGELVPGGEGFGEDLSTTIPPIESVPGGPHVSIIKVESTIGPNHLLYEKRVHGHPVRVHGHIVHFRPRGISIPERCPRGGFRFKAAFVFEDGTTAMASSAVPCPPSSKRHK